MADRLAKTIHREAELQRRHLRFWDAIKGSPLTRFIKSLAALFDQDELDEMKRLGVIK